MSFFPASGLGKDMNQDISVPFVILETMFSGSKNSFLFDDFSKIITFNYEDDLDSFFEEMEECLNEGFWICGYFSYEFGYFLEPALFSFREKSNRPLVWLGVSKKPKIANTNKLTIAGCGNDDSFEMKNFKPAVNFGEYKRKVKQIKRFLEEGLTYQVNLTFKNKFDYQGSEYSLYSKLKKAQPTKYGAVINTGEEVVLSLSPELFFRVQGNRIISRPMKGTVSRGVTVEEDAINRRWLENSEKIKAENLMIVDLLRNDLGRIADKVGVTSLFEIEKYKTLYQMTSTIEAKLSNNVAVKDVFTSLFPCGSVTGAPKIKTMRIIKELEVWPRGVYTGAIGYISPQREMCFNIAIRTVYLKSGEGEIGVGGGIVYDSIDKTEYEEAVLKAKFFIDNHYPFFLIETILWTKGEGYFLLPLHLKRVSASSGYFCIPLNVKKLRNALARTEKELMVSRAEKFKVRVLVDEDGDFTIEKQELSEIIGSIKIKVSSKRVNPKDVFLYHKTTNRKIYDEELTKARSEGFFDVIFLNRDQQVTEGAVTNIFIAKKGKLYTPPVECGLLNGVLRESFLRQGKAEEKIIFLKDVMEADRVYAGNSVRGVREAGISLERKVGRS